MTIACKTKEVIFADGSKIVVSEENWDIGMLRDEMERRAEENPSPDAKTQIFKTVFWPKLASCSTGDVPTEDEARKMPSSEIDKWYMAVREVNPRWFIVLDELSETAKTELQKKKVKRRRKSGSGSKTS